MKSTSWTNPRVAVAVVLAALGGPALAEKTTPPTTTEEIRSFYQVQKMPPMSVFKMVDTNQDGAVSKEEFMAFMEKLFEKWDTNHDGSLSKDEWKGGVEKAKAGQQGAPPKKQNQPRAE